jgi:hypothetical protein
MSKSEYHKKIENISTRRHETMLVTILNTINTKCSSHILSLLTVRIIAAIPGHVTEMDFCQEEISQKINWTRTLRGQTDLTACPEGVTGMT